MSAASAMASTALFQGAGPGSTPRAALQDILVTPVSMGLAKQVIVQGHYLHSMPGGSKLAFGVFALGRMLGAVILGAGPAMAYRLVEGAVPDDCVTLSRLWLSDELPKNSESKVLGVVLRSLGRHTKLKIVISYADPSQGHLGTIYQATGWIYTGLSEAMPLYDIGDGKLHHSRSLAHSYGTHSLKHFQRQGVPITTVPQSRKHRYLYFLDGDWRARLNVEEQTYPKGSLNDEDC